MATGHCKSTSFLQLRGDGVHIVFISYSEKGEIPYQKHKNLVNFSIPPLIQDQLKS